MLCCDLFQGRNEMNVLIKQTHTKILREKTQVEQFFLLDSYEIR